VYFQDLTPYEYSKWGSPGLNVGWLDAAHPFPTGDVPSGFIERLSHLLRSPVAQARGFHVCEFCDVGTVPEPRDQAAINAHYQRLMAAGVLSSAEIRVVASDGRVYAAPMLICHYVEAHGYRPPDEFVDAVMKVEYDRVV
jgi:hypothetical protein